MASFLKTTLIILIIISSIITFLYTQYENAEEPTYTGGSDVDDTSQFEYNEEIGANVTGRVPTHQRLPELWSPY